VTFVPPVAVRSQLRNGIPVFVVKQDSPFVAIRLVALGGLPELGPDRAEAINLTLDLMRAGTTDQSWNTLRQTYAAESMTEPTSYVQPDYVAMAMVAPAEKLSRAADLLAGIVRRPAFDETEVARIGLMHAQGRESQANEVLTIADRALPRLLFGKHPYAALAGTPAQIRALKRADVVAIHARLFQASRLAFFVAGSVEPDDATKALDATFGDMKATGAAPPAAPTPRPPSGPRLLLVDKPGTSIAAIVGGFTGPAFAAPDVWAAIVATNVLADGVEGRLALRLREELGAVGWIGLERSQIRSGGWLAWETRASTDRVVQVLQESDRIIRALASKGPTDDELVAMRNRAAFSFAASFEAASDTARVFADGWGAGEPLERLAERPKRIAALSADDVRAAAARYLDADRMRVVVVGDASSLAQPLAELGWGPVDVRDLEGRPVAAHGSARASR